MSTAKCVHCGQTSRVDSDATGRTWFRQHRRQECAARRSGPTGASRSALVGRDRRVDAELEARMAAARRLKPIPVPASPTYTPSTEWVDVSTDRWGAPPHGPQLLARQWSQGNCLKACIASLLGAPIDRVPDPSIEFNEGLDGWRERYDKRLRADTGHRLEVIPAHACPPTNRNQLWIACIAMDGPADHVVVARDHYIVHDPLGEFMGPVPMRRLVDGMVVAPTRRAVPVFRGRHAIAPA